MRITLLRTVKGSRWRRGLVSAATLVLGVGLIGATGPAAAAPVHVDNPFLSAKGYVNPDWVASVNQEATNTGGTLGQQMATVATYSTAVWMDRIRAITDGRGLRGHLDEALAQAQSSGSPVAIQVVIYNLPNRDCAALASNGELRISENGLERYKTEYIDPITGILSDPAYSGLRIVTIVEPDSLPNLITNLSEPDCAEADSSGAYVEGIRYALSKFAPIANVYSYLDISHSGWLGWDSNFNPAVDKYVHTLQSPGPGLDSVDGFVTNTANYTPVEEPFLTDPNQQVGGQQVQSAKFYEWNPHFDEFGYAQALRNAFIAKGMPSSIGMLIDSSRNGWGGPDRPTGPSTSTDLNTYVNESRIDTRPHRGGWCNQAGAGIGERPTANPATGFDAYVWVKPPGESDGISDPNFEPDPNDPNKRHDPMCDPDAMNRYDSSLPTNALPNAPHAGRWFPEHFEMLVRNAYPPIPTDDTPPPADTETPTAPSGLAVTGTTDTSVSLSWTASTDDVGVTAYDVYQGATVVETVTGSPPLTSATVTGLSPSTTYTFHVAARDAAANTSTASDAVTATTDAAPPPPSGELKAQYRNYDASAPGDNQAKPGLAVVNTGTADVDLSSVTVRYWFTRDAGASTFSTYCDYALRGCGNLTHSVVHLATPRTGADAYLEVRYTAGAGTLPAGASTGDAQLRFNKTDWSAFTESDDYSWSGTQTSYGDWTKMTLYVNGALTWGTEP